MGRVQQPAPGIDRVKVQAGDTSVSAPSLIAAEHYINAFLKRADGTFEQLGAVTNGRITVPANSAGGEAVFFIGGALGTAAASFAWELAGWNGVCATGVGFALCGLIPLCILRRRGGEASASVRRSDADA